MTQTLLVELLTEELPPKALANLGIAFAEGIYNRLVEQDLVDPDELGQAGLLQPWTWYATPRRLGVLIRHVRANAPDQPVRQKILPVSVALDANGAPTPPLAKKLVSLGFPDLKVSDLQRVADGKSDSFFYSYTKPGANLQSGLQTALEETIVKLPIPKVMSYQRPDGSTVQFVRPVHKLVALHGSGVIPITLLGLSASNTTFGHRFLSQDELSIGSAESYASTLQERGKVIADVGTPNVGHHFVILAEPVDDRIVSSVAAERQAHRRPRHCGGQPPATAGTMERSSLSFSGVLSPDPKRMSSSFR